MIHNMWLSRNLVAHVVANNELNLDNICDNNEREIDHSLGQGPQPHCM